MAALSRQSLRICPAWPTKGCFNLSSSFPGASPISIIAASAGPAPNTTCVRVVVSSGQLLHC
jgi:hypothetical protein